MSCCSCFINYMMQLALLGSTNRFGKGRFWVKLKETLLQSWVLLILKSLSQIFRNCTINNFLDVLLKLLSVGNILINIVLIRKWFLPAIYTIYAIYTTFCFKFKVWCSYDLVDCFWCHIRFLLTEIANFRHRMCPLKMRPRHMNTGAPCRPCCSLVIGSPVTDLNT